MNYLSKILEVYNFKLIRIQEDYLIIEFLETGERFSVKNEEFSLNDNLVKLRKRIARKKNEKFILSEFMKNKVKNF